MASTEFEFKKEPSYVDKLVARLISKGVGSEIIGHIKEFADEQYNERKARDELNVGVVNFGKYKGKKIDAIMALDRPYCLWLQKNATYLTTATREMLNDLLSMQPMPKKDDVSAR